MTRGRGRRHSRCRRVFLLKPSRRSRSPFVRVSTAAWPFFPRTWLEELAKRSSDGRKSATSSTATGGWVKSARAGLHIQTARSTAVGELLFRRSRRRPDDGVPSRLLGEDYLSRHPVDSFTHCALFDSCEWPLRVRISLPFRAPILAVLSCLPGDPAFPPAAAVGRNVPGHRRRVAFERVSPGSASPFSPEMRAVLSSLPVMIYRPVLSKRPPAQTGPTCALDFPIVSSFWRSRAAAVLSLRRREDLRSI